MKKFVAFIVGITPFFLFPDLASAHSFGKLYSLPVPFWMYLYGGAAAIIASFLVIGYFFNKSKVADSYPTVELSKIGFFRILTLPLFFKIIKLISVFLFVLTILSGIIDSESYSGFNMTFFWIIFVLGLTYLTAFIGNVYSVINPYKVITEWIENATGTKFKGIYKYSKKVGYYPALLFYVIFIWIEIFSESTPFSLSVLIIQYSIITSFGIAAIGKAAWFQYCDFFSVFFRLVGKIAPVEYVPSAKKNKPGSLVLRPPFIGLLKESADHFSLVIFILFMLSSTAYDGLRETLPWTRLYWGNLDSFMKPVLGDNSYDAFQTLGLILSPLVFLIIYLIFISLTKIITKQKKSIKELSLSFAFSLIPIAFVYHVAHYYTLLPTEGLNIISLISDPFGLGWNLFGTTNWSSGIAAIDTNFVWHSQVALILVGHIASVYLAHIVAIRIFPTHKKALISQVPMLFLMVAFTAIGLWVLSQPITSGQVQDTSAKPAEEPVEPDFNEPPIFIPTEIDTESTQ